MTNESAILGLLAALYRDTAALQQANAALLAENEALRQQLATQQGEEATP